jgi:type II secretory pathway component PulF
MLFSAQLPLASLVEVCRILRHSLGAGITLRDVFRQLATRGPKAARPVAERIRKRLERGDSLEAALMGEGNVFPPLLIALARVGERTGHLPEIFGELEKYYLLQQKLRREFRARSFPALFQLGLAFLVIAFVLFVLGMVSASRGGQAPAVLGVRGSGAAVVFLVLSFGSVALLYVAYLVLTRALRHKAGLDAWLLRVPALGPCLQALALGRFALAARLTLDSDLPIAEALRLGMLATGNAAFAARTDAVLEGLEEGENLTEALSRARIFPQDFLNMVAVGEEGGRVPEILRHQAEHYHEEASRRMQVLVRTATYCVWLAYAVFTIIAIFTLAQRYFSQLPK